MNIMPNEKTHLTFGGSSAHRWLRCAGSIKLCATLPPQPENEHMAAGTRAHALLELAIREHHDSVLEFEGRSLQPGWPAYDQSDVEAVQVALDYVNSLLACHPDHIMYTEGHVVLREDVGGTVDIAIYAPGPQALHIIDYKHGRGKYVSIDDNPQIKLYAAALAMKFAYPIASVHGTIIQPRCQVGEPVRTVVMSTADMIAFSDEVDEAVEKALSPNPVFTPGDIQCHWCPAAHACPAIQQASTVVVSEDFKPMFDPVENVTLTIPAARIMREDPRALAQALRAFPVMEEWIDAVKQNANDLASSGVEIPGFKLVPKRATRKWIDENSLETWAQNNGYLDKLKPPKMLTVAQAEKVLKPLGAVKDMAAFVEKKSSGYNLVPVEAPGDAVNPLQLAAGDFAGSVTV